LAAIETERLSYDGDLNAARAAAALDLWGLLSEFERLSVDEERLEKTEQLLATELSEEEKRAFVLAEAVLC